MLNDSILNKQRENFKNFMAANNLTASSWAKKSNVSEATIRHYLSGRNKSITAINLEKLAQAANVDSDILLNGENYNKDYIKIHKDLFIQTFIDVNDFIHKLNLKLKPDDFANVLLSWYELAQIHKNKNLTPDSIEPFKQLVKNLAKK